MREKYFEDLGLDDGIDILDKFNIDVDEILDKENDNEQVSKDEKK